MARDRPTARRVDWQHPAPDRLGPDAPGFDAIIEEHGRALVRGDDGYVDPSSGLFVFTAAYLARRPCCDQGCRHCPWDRAGE